MDPWLTLLLASSGSKIIYEEDQCLHYMSDSEGNRIPNFSRVGYRLGNKKIPDVPVVQLLHPVTGDNTGQIQEAINIIAEFPLDSQGLRGSILLAPGVFPIHGSIYLPSNGIVLKGTYDLDSDSLQTTLLGMGNSPIQRNLIIVGGNPSASWKKEIGSSRTEIRNSFIPAGSMTLEMESVDPFQTGSKIMIHHPSTEKSLKYILMKIRS